MSGRRHDRLLVLRLQDHLSATDRDVVSVVLWSWWTEFSKSKKDCLHNFFDSFSKSFPDIGSCRDIISSKLLNPGIGWSWSFSYSYIVLSWSRLFESNRCFKVSGDCWVVVTSSCYYSSRGFTFSYYAKRFWGSFPISRSLLDNQINRNSCSFSYREVKHPPHVFFFQGKFSH